MGIHIVINMVPHYGMSGFLHDRLHPTSFAGAVHLRCGHGIPEGVGISSRYLEGQGTK